MGMDNNSVKENIIRRRKVRKLSQQDVAETIGMSRTAYRNIEKGGTKLLSDNLGKIAEALGVDSEELVLGYSVEKDTEGRIRDENSYRRMYEDLASSCNAERRKRDEEISRLRHEVETLKEHIAMQNDLIRTKNEIIQMLKKLGNMSDISE